jgi:predicted RNase H-like HicB family nuclease
MPTHIVSFKLQVNIRVEKDGNEFHAFCPHFKGLHIGGKTYNEALKNAKDAIAAYVLSLIKHNEPIPCCTVLDEDIYPDNFNAKNIHSANVKIPIEELAVA